VHVVAERCSEFTARTLDLVQVSAGADFDRFESLNGVVAGLVPATPNVKALRVCPETLDWIAKLSQHEAN
jgi:hypothetical protein